MLRCVFRGVRTAALVIGVLTTHALVLAAQPPGTTAAQDGFVPVAPGELGEQLPATPLVFAAYAFVWVALLAYVFSLWRRITRVERELAEVAARMRP